MKMTPVLFAACISFTASAQFGLPLPQPAMQVIPTPTIPPGTPALSVPLPAPAAAQVVATPLATNLSAVATLLVNLQTATEDLLPWLTNFNNSFDFATLPTAAPAGFGVVSPGAAFRGNFSLALASNFFAEANIGSGPGVTNLEGAAAPSVPPNAFPLPAGYANSIQSRDTLRALLILQDDLQRLLPTLAALNGSTNSAIAPSLRPGFVPGAFTNTFGGAVFGP